MFATMFCISNCKQNALQLETSINDFQTEVYMSCKSIEDLASTHDLTLSFY